MFDANDSKSLTRQNLERFTEATGRQEAQQRDQSMPSPEPKFRNDSTLSSRVKARRAPKKAMFTASQLNEEEHVIHQVADLLCIHQEPAAPDGTKPQPVSSLPAETDGAMRTREDTVSKGVPTFEYEYEISWERSTPAGASRTQHRMR